MTEFFDNKYINIGIKLRGNTLHRGVFWIMIKVPDPETGLYHELLSPRGGLDRGQVEAYWFKIIIIVIIDIKRSVLIL